jgi:hypothetical protein
MGAVMIDPEIQYSLWRFEQSRRDAKLERRRAYLLALNPQPQPDMAPDEVEDSACCELEAAS